MFAKISSAVSSRIPSAANLPLPSSHHASPRARTYVDLVTELRAASVPVDESDCATCEDPCTPGGEERSTGTGMVVEAGGPIWDGKSYDQYVLDKYGDLGELPAGFDTDWDSALAGSGSGGKGRLLVISTGKSDWERDHTDEKANFPHKLDKYLGSLPSSAHLVEPRLPKQKDFTVRPPIQHYVFPATLPPPSTSPTSSTPTLLPPPSLYSSSLVSQSDDLEDQTVIVFPDWKVVNEVENSLGGAEALWNDALRGGLGRAGATSGGDQVGVGRKRSYVLPYRAIVLLCTHKRRDKRCHIAGPLLRHALLTCLDKHHISYDQDGASLAHPHHSALEEVQGTDAERETVVSRQISGIPGVHGGEGGEVGVFNINHLGGHRYAGVMIILFPSGAYLSYGRLTPQEVPRVVEETIVRGKVVPGLLRSAAGVTRGSGTKGCGILGW